MITGYYSHYQLNVEQFNNLFTNNVDVNTLDLLGKSAADGNLDCIDMLHNLALRHDYIGKKSESILFDLFSGKTRGKVGIDEEIQQTSLKLYETACDAKGKDNTDMSKLYSPSKLLYMAGSAMKSITQKQELSNIFNGMDRAQSQFEQFDNVDLWSNGRMLMTDEINNAMNGLISNTDNFSLNFPIGLIEPINKLNMLSEQIAEKRKYSKDLDKKELFPINTGGHWVLFVLYKNENDNNPECVVFNSSCELNKDVKNHLIDSAKIAGVTKENIEFINGDMQENVPNGCGVFVVKVAALLSNTPERKPVDIFNDFIKDFSKLSAEDQMLFNIQNRRQQYEHNI
ncbi:type III secretion system effector deubiquitinase SseL [Salmonella enterica]|uniref:ElaD/SseL family deubiquitinase n=1 Tax=Salmonella enterica TaxID=28901 RepID=UPI000B548041|nr:ElaD/SseL family deubiquitinase [Salmonella enterica]ECU8746540.1 type III secretion system effector deubiquitinase SseL [Salmonella enterica subsp. diarizonae str. CFSAN000558]EEE1295453.1 type III secretion system effector deubiquitinase SseL [Salmonella enterica subsp. diarizonae]HAE8381261.1 type III secretion system effector deubiquitinase SseL [Salmonella enterica subsp. diarizonae serovar 50:k:z]ASG75572.1 type III secretion system effector deubiquitinase SseL [Salmonella enterica sub